MRGPQHRKTRRAIVLLGLCLALSASATSAGAATRVHADADSGAAAATVRAEIAAVKRYWTPARMRGARPLDLSLDAAGAGHLEVGPPAEATGASASWAEVATPSDLPYAVNGRVFVRQAGEGLYCSGTAINSPTRQLVLTAGHCVATGPRRGGPNIMSSYMEFVPAYTGGLAPFGAFVARRGEIFALRPWTRSANPDFDMGAFLTHPNAEGVNVADAVGGGATIATDLPREQKFQTFGYPGDIREMQGCRSSYRGDDKLTNPLFGPPTQGIGCRWAPGASGGGWLIGDGSQIDGITTYHHLHGGSRTFGPYFSQENVGKLVHGL
jgi:V8-like Glu-specific endopeptidase